MPTPFELAKPAALALLLAAAPVAASVGSYDVLIRAGDALPDGGVVGGFSQGVVLNNAGQVAFGGGASGDQAAYRLDGTAITPLIRAGDALPGGGTFNGFAHHLHLTDAGHLAATVLTNTTDLTVALIRTDGNPLAELYRTGDPLPGGGTYAGEPIPWLMRSINTAGTAVIGDRRGRNYVLADGSGLTHLVANEDVLSGGNRRLTDNDHISLSPLRDDGRVAAYTRLHDLNQNQQPVTTRDAILTAGAGGTSVLAATGTLAEGYSFSSLGSMRTIGPAVRGEDGGVLFTGIRNANPDINRPQQSGIWRATGGGQFTRAAHSGQPLLGSDLPNAEAVFGTNASGNTGSDYFGIYGHAVVPGEHFDSALMLRTPTGIRQLARIGQARPGQTDGEFFVTYGQITTNSAGQAAFQADVGTSNRNKRYAIYYFDETLGLIEVAVVNGTFNGGTLRSLDWRGDNYTGDETTGFNESGQIAFSYTVQLTTGLQESGVALWTPPSVDDLIGGDATLDGTVDLADFGVLRANFGIAHGYVTTGDFNGDGLVDLSDFGILRANFGSSAGLAEMDAWAASVPEPGVAGLVLGGGLLLRRRK
jgi:hypothetical protein